jgi:hypothetical protein
MITFRNKGIKTAFAALLLATAAWTDTNQASAQMRQRQAPAPAAGKWMTGDFHQHTLFTDGSWKMRDVMYKGFGYGLNWQANSEHGGARVTDGLGRYWDDINAYATNPIIGDVASSSVAGVSHRVMWRWQSLRDFGFPMIQSIRKLFPDKVVMTGMEWNMPGHEHCSTGIVATDAVPIAQFEYLFDASDADITGGLAQGWGGKITKNDHAKAVAGAAWMQQNYPSTSWIVPAHPERAASYKIEHFRDLNNAAPTVAFGFEGLPGHQKENPRGSYTTGAVGAGTYGGAGIFIAKVGGLWDAMLGEGRHWWNFVNSDFHDVAGDFWPGEYAKNHVYVTTASADGRPTGADIVNAMRSGNSYAVHGDLIDALQYTVQDWRGSATMGGELQSLTGESVMITIKVHSPAKNNHGDPVALDHIDLISGEVRGLIPPVTFEGNPNPDYTKDTNDTTRVLATFTKNDWRDAGNGWKVMRYIVNNVNKNMYFRLRGTNLPPNTPYETDANGNPVADSDAINALKISVEQESWRDLWFYSNPIFVSIQ